jgi:hypothetical protein
MDKSSLHEFGAESGSPKPECQKPSLKEEMGELQRHAEEFGVSFDALIKALESAELEELNDDDWRNMKNCDSSDPAWTLDQARSV